MLDRVKVIGWRLRFFNMKNAEGIRHFLRWRAWESMGACLQTVKWPCAKSDLVGGGEYVSNTLIQTYTEIRIHKFTYKHKNYIYMYIYVYKCVCVCVCVCLWMCGLCMYAFIEQIKHILSDDVFLSNLGFDYSRYYI